MRFSIITPSFDQLAWLRLCVASVADQSGVAVEHIVQDAGTKGVEEEQRRWREAGTRGNHVLGVFVEKDAGMYDAINRGLGKATGEICAWLNCDEQYLPGTLERAARFFAKNPDVEVLFGDALLVDDEGGALSYRRAVLPQKLHIRLVHLNTLSCATFFRRSLLERELLFKPEWKSIGDAVWVHDLLDARVRMAVLPEPLGVFTITGMNLSAASTGPGSENDRWRNTQGAPPLWMATPVSLLHRLRKLSAGSYRRRNLDYLVYTLNSPTERVLFRAKGLGFDWPGPA